ncbi:MAG: ABC transporter permease [Nitrospirae bacterium]|nr:ABC transporter permease [Nitrospirota bacterium]
MVKAFSLIWKYRHILLTTTKNDIRAKYAGSVLGLVWAFLYPLLFLGVYTLVYVAILKVNSSTMTTPEYIVLIFSGLVPFLGFADALGAGVGSVTSSSNLIKNTLFPIELVPLKTVLASTVTQVVGLIILFLALVVMRKVGMFILLVPLIFLVQLIFTAGFIWFVSSVNVLVRDLSQMTSVLVIFFMMVSPIGYTADMVPAGFRMLSYLNPLYSIITMYREVMVYNRLPPLSETVFFVLMSFATFAAGFFVFSKLKQVFADYV